MLYSLCSMQFCINKSNLVCARHCTPIFSPFFQMHGKFQHIWKYIVSEKNTDLIKEKKMTGLHKSNTNY